MVRSVHVDWYTDDASQDLLQDLTAEAIELLGHDCWYLPRVAVNGDPVLSEPEYSRYDDAFMLEFYVKTTVNMGGEGALLSKFGVELRDEMILTVSKKTFGSEVTAERPDVTRPREGDLIYVPMIGSLFTIKYVDKKAFFYQFGDLTAWDLSLEMYEDSSAEFDTGVPEIDAMYGTRATRDVLETALRAESGHILVDEVDQWALEYESELRVDDLSQNVEFEGEGDEILAWDEADPFSVGGKF